MKNTALQTRIEYGDFQTPPELADRICHKLTELGVKPDVVIEPTCGTGAFIEAAARDFPDARKVIGIEINTDYLNDLHQRVRFIPNHHRVELQQGDFFSTDWQKLLQQCDGQVLILGNPPWVTNSVQGGLGGSNLPAKTNFQHRQGLEALTGKSNFDISEWMLIRLAEVIRQCGGVLAVLCKTAVARKVLHHLYLGRVSVARAAVFSIDAARYFGVAVEASLLYCDFSGETRISQYEMHDDLETGAGIITGWRHELLVRDLAGFDENCDLFGQSDYKWRSGIKHDCSDVMEFRLLDGALINGLNEAVEIEETFVYPLLKGADVANGRVDSTSRYVLVTQKNTGDDTRGIRLFAPKTWNYLDAHTERLDQRKSRIYRDNPRFSVFGVGRYTFAPWKIAICGLYKRLEFHLVGPMDGKPVIFDDTVYFLDFETRENAVEVLRFLQSNRVQQFLASMIFWDDKRPIKAAVLNRLKVQNPGIRVESLLVL